MGNSCTSSSQIITRKTTGVATVIKLDGKPLEFRQPVRAGDILSENPNCFLCSSEAMSVDEPVAQLDGDEELQLGQLYFLLPISKSHFPLSLHDMCALAIKASAALGDDSKLNVSTRENRRLRRPTGGGGVFSARALVAADASLGWMIKVFMVARKFISIVEQRTM